MVIILDPLPNRENMLVYAKPLQIYKGIDNRFKLQIRNQDQKLQSLLDTTIVFNLFNSATRELVFTRLCPVYTDKKGLAYTTLSESELNDVAAGNYNYSIKLVTGEGEQRIVYSDDNYNAQGQARVNEGVYPDFAASLQPNLGPFYNNNPNATGFSDNGIQYTNVLNVRDRVKTRSIIQTVQYYGTDFTGTVIIQGCLEASMNAYPSTWFDIDTQTFDNFNGCSFSNFTGKISLVRFKITTDSGTLDKILYRP